MKEKLGFIGAGTVATTFAVKLAEGGYPVVAVSDIKPAMVQRMAARIQGCQIYDTNQGVVDATDLAIIATWDQAMITVINQINWRPLYTDFEKIVEDFLEEIRSRPRYYGLA